MDPIRSGQWARRKGVGEEMQREREGEKVEVREREELPAPPLSEGVITWRFYDTSIKLQVELYIYIYTVPSPSP